MRWQIKTHPLFAFTSALTFLTEAVEASPVESPGGKTLSNSLPGNATAYPCLSDAFISAPTNCVHPLSKRDGSGITVPTIVGIIVFSIILVGLCAGLKAIMTGMFRLFSFMNVRNVDHAIELRSTSSTRLHSPGASSSNPQSV
ncbi:hypothetical protein H0H92_005603 [Tricholoma furcatifolium]|nr:hypothetical protein H0H92_005603 [Tricholoma furcatifolium]